MVQLCLCVDCPETVQDDFCIVPPQIAGGEPKMHLKTRRGEPTQLAYFLQHVYHQARVGVEEEIAAKESALEQKLALQKQAIEALEKERDAAISRAMYLEQGLRRSEYSRSHLKSIADVLFCVAMDFDDERRRHSLHNFMLQREQMQDIFDLSPVEAFQN